MDDPSNVSSLDVGLDLQDGQGWPSRVSLSGWWGVGRWLKAKQA